MPITHKVYKINLLKSNMKADLRPFFNVSNTLLSVIDGETKLQQVNKNFAKILKFSADELLGEPVIKFLDQNDQRIFKEKLEKLFSEKNNFIIELRFIDKEANTKYLLWSAEYCPKNDLVYSIAKDISSYKYEEEALKMSENQFLMLTEHLNRKTEQLKGLNVELEEFAYIISHDLKAPLRGIANLATWLQEDWSDKINDPTFKEDLENLVKNTKKMNSLIEGILDYSRASRAKEEISKVNCFELVNDICNSLQAPKHIKIKVCEKLPEINYGATHIYQILQNLISNAIKYNDKESGTIKVYSEDLGEKWLFSVEDNGPGIAEKHQEMIFKIFQTANVEERADSTGVGLTIVKKLVEKYGGSIDIKSMPGQGSTFSFTILKGIK